MPYYEFVWTDEIIEHLAEHGVGPKDFEAAVMNPNPGQTGSERAEVRDDRVVGAKRLTVGSYSAFTSSWMT